MALRKSLAVLLSAVMLTLGAPIVGIAQAQGSTLRGQVVDAGGRGSAGMRVELVSDRLVVSTTISGPDGHFSFSGLPADNYVVRTTVNGQPSGVRVSVMPGQQAQHALIVLPSTAQASPAVVAILGVNGILTTVVVAVSVVAGEIVVEVQKSNDEEKLFETRAAAQAYVAQQVQAQLGLPPNNPVAQTIINQIVNNLPVGDATPPPPVVVGSGSL